MKQVHWNQIYKNGRKFSPVSEILLDQVLPKKKGSVLDIGSGTGELMRQLKARGFKPTGIDLSDEATKQAKQLDPEMIYLTGDFMEAELGTFDVIVANKVIAFNDIGAFLSRVAEHLAVGGTFILITPVTYPNYADKYDDNTKSISVDNAEVEDKVVERFGNADIVDIRRFGDYGEELTIVATK